MFSPRQLINYLLLLVLAFVLLLLYVLQQQPSLGFSVHSEKHKVVVSDVQPWLVEAGLEIGDELKAIGFADGRISLLYRNKLPMETLERRQHFTSLRDYHLSQASLYRELIQPHKYLLLSDGREITYAQQDLSLGHLPYTFWLILTFGLAGCLVSLLLWAWYPQRKETICLMLNGCGFLILTIPSAALQTDMAVFHPVLVLFLHCAFVLGHGVFLAFGLGVLIYFPQPLRYAARLVYTLITLAAVVVAYGFLSKWQWHKAISDQYLFVSGNELYAGIGGAFLIALGLCAWQWKNTQRLPLQRLQTYWVALAWLVGPVVYLTFYMLPMLLNQPPILGRVGAWAVVFCSYWMLLLVIGKFHLIRIERHFKIAWIWILGSGLVIGADVLMVTVIQLEEKTSLSLILVMVIWVYFPVRYYLYQRSASKRHRLYHQVFFEIMWSLMKSSIGREADSQALWNNLLIRCFAPISIQTSAEQNDTEIRDRGQKLFVAAGKSTTAFELDFAENGSRLFNQDDKNLITSLQVLFERMVSVQYAFVAGQAKERNRIRRDLHDQVGHKLLSLIYAAKDETTRKIAQSTLEQLRDLIRALREEPVHIGNLVAELRGIAQEFCDHAGITLKWHQSAAQKEVKIHPHRYFNIINITRELLTNAARHGHAGRISMYLSWDTENLTLSVSDNGVGFNESSVSSGFGLDNINSRIEELDAILHWHHDLGTRAQISIPIIAKVETNGFY